MTEESLIELVKNIQSGSGTEEEIDNMVKTFAKNVPDPKAIDYIFAIQYSHLTSSEIVKKAFSYNPIRL